MHRRTHTSWEDVTRFVAARPSGTKWAFPKAGLPPPESAGMYQSHGLPMGQTQDYRKPLGDERGLHVQDMGDHYSVHVDRYHPDDAPISHLVADAPYVALGMLVGSKVFERSKIGWLGGALMGLGLGVLFMRNETTED